MREAEAAERIVESEAKDFEDWRRQQDLKPLIITMREHVRTTLAAELERTLPRLSGDKEKDKAALERMLDAMVNKVVHHPVAEVKRAAERGEVDVVLAATRLFPAALPSSTATDVEAGALPIATPARRKT